MCNSRPGPEKALTREFYIRILRRVRHPPDLVIEMVESVSAILEFGEFALTELRVGPEFSRLVQVDAIGADGASSKLRADAGERAALARRLGLPGMTDLRADVSLRRTAIGLVRLNVDYSANVVQLCVVTLEPVAAKVADHFSLLCEGEKKHGKKDDAVGDVFVDPFGEDPIEILNDGRIDIGELVVQHLSLALDPYPRMAGMGLAAAMTRAGVDGSAVMGSGVATGRDDTEEEAADTGPDGVSSFAALEHWRSRGRSGGQDEGGAGSGGA
jgi:hypothetical protein